MNNSAIGEKGLEQGQSGVRIQPQPTAGAGPVWGDINSVTAPQDANVNTLNFTGKPFSNAVEPAPFSATKTVNPQYSAVPITTTENPIAITTPSQFGTLEQVVSGRNENAVEQNQTAGAYVQKTEQEIQAAAEKAKESRERLNLQIAQINEFLSGEARSEDQRDPVELYMGQSGTKQESQKPPQRGGEGMPNTIVPDSPASNELARKYTAEPMEPFKESSQSVFSILFTPVRAVIGVITDFPEALHVVSGMKLEDYGKTIADGVTEGGAELVKFVIGSPKEASAQPTKEQEAQARINKEKAAKERAYYDQLKQNEMTVKNEDEQRLNDYAEQVGVQGSTVEQKNSWLGKLRNKAFGVIGRGLKNIHALFQAALGRKDEEAQQAAAKKRAEAASSQPGDAQINDPLGTKKIYEGSQMSAVNAGG